MEDKGEAEVAEAIQRLMHREERTLKEQGASDRDFEDFMDCLVGEVPSQEWAGAQCVDDTLSFCSAIRQLSHISDKVSAGFTILRRHKFATETHGYKWNWSEVGRNR